MVVEAAWRMEQVRSRGRKSDEVMRGWGATKGKKEPEESQGRAGQVWGTEPWHETGSPKAREGSCHYRLEEPSEKRRRVDEPGGTG